MYFISIISSSGSQYYRYTRKKSVDYGYPRDISIWVGLPPHVDAAFQDVNMNTYFFSNQSSYLFDDVSFRVGLMRFYAPLGYLNYNGRPLMTSYIFLDIYFSRTETSG